MKSTLFAIACATLVAAQGSVPSCARPCVTEATTGDKIAGCSSFEISCICKNGNFLDSIACCLEKNCDDAGKEAAVKYAAQICGSAGVKDLPTEVVCKESAASTSDSASSSSTDTSTSSSESSMVTGAAGAAGETPMGTSTGSETSTETTSGSGGSEETDDGGAAAGVNAPIGLMGAMLLGWFAL